MALSYQHTYHAGNCADVHKHLALLILLQYLKVKETPFCYIDTHAGRGVYDLSSEAALKTGEARQGILRLWSETFVHPALLSYRQVIAQMNPNSDSIRLYPGSAALAQSQLRAQDRAILLERHPQEVEALKKALRRDKRITIHDRDSYEGLPALVPPAIKRGLILIDPSYEEKQEYGDIAELLIKGWQRWSNAIYLLWYPLLAEERHLHLLRKLTAAGMPKCINSEFIWDEDTSGMVGSGLFLVNTPWHFDEQFEALMREVSGTLGRGRGAAHRLRKV